MYNNKYATHFAAFLFFISFSIHSEINRTYVSTHTKKFEHYLNNLRNSMRLPTSIIKQSMKLLGYSQEEIDAVPIAFPFIYDQKYKSVWHDLTLDTFAIEANDLLRILKPIFEQVVKNAQTRRKRVHECIHQWNCRKMGLPLTTTTKDLALLVEKRQIDLEQFFHYQLVQFFVKFYLDIV